MPKPSDASASTEVSASVSQDGAAAGGKQCTLFFYFFIFFNENVNEVSYV